MQLFMEIAWNILSIHSCTNNLFSEKRQFFKQELYAAIFDLELRKCHADIVMNILDQHYLQGKTRSQALVLIVTYMSCVRRNQNSSTCTSKLANNVDMWL